MAIQAQLFSDNLGFHVSNPQDLSMENNFCGFNQFSFNLQHKPLQYQQIMHYNYPQIQNLQHHGGSFNMTDDHQTMPFSNDLASLVQKQRLEFDQLTVLQNERMKLALQEQRKQLLSLILKKYEANIGCLLRQKDEEIAKAVNKSMELEDILKRIEIENETWQKIAKEKEEMILSLNNTIEQLRESVYLSTNLMEDAESCCDVVLENRSPELIEVKLEENLEKISKKVQCKGCNIGKSCIVILPCRHLCICESCEAFLHTCPVCGTEKKATIQALI